MTNPDLSSIVRRASVLATASVVPMAALLLLAGRRAWALGLCFGVLVALVNAGMLVWRINRSTERPSAQARRLMSQGMGIRFAMVLLAAVVIINVEPHSIPGFVLGVLLGMAVVLAAAARALFAAVAVDRVPAGLAVGSKGSTVP